MIKTIIIANVAEAFGESITQIKNRKEKALRLTIEQSLSQRSMFWDGDDKVVVTSCQIPKLLFQKNLEISRYKNIVNINPNRSEISLCKSIIKDRQLFNLLKSIIKSNPGVNISPYSFTRKFLELTKKLEENQLFFTADATPKDSFDVVSYLDSKLGFRLELLKLQKQFSEIKIPFGFICSNWKETTRALKWFYKNNTSCFLKANLGESGWGLLPIKKETFVTFSEIEVRVKSILNKESIWQKNWIIVEEWISHVDSPSVEVFITDSGPKVTYVCQQVVDDRGIFSGITLGKGVVDVAFSKRLTHISLIIGNRYWQMGYRGYFDIDFVVSDEDILFAVETNMRRTGGTHVYDFAYNAFGANWFEKVILLSKDNFIYGDKIMNEQEIFNRVSNILYTGQKRKGIVISLISQSIPLLGYFIVGTNLKEIDKLKDRFESSIKL